MLRLTIAALLGAATIYYLRRIIMATRDELLTEITGIKDQVVKSRGEFVAKITGLEEKLAAAQPITLEDLAELKSEGQVSDDVNPDPVIEPAPVETPEVPAEPVVEAPVEVETPAVDETPAEDTTTA